jgi:hypothetical protein
LDSRTAATAEANATAIAQISFVPRSKGDIASTHRFPLEARNQQAIAGAKTLQDAINVVADDIYAGKRTQLAGITQAQDGSFAVSDMDLTHAAPYVRFTPERSGYQLEAIRPGDRLETRFTMVNGPNANSGRVDDIWFVDSYLADQHHQVAGPLPKPSSIQLRWEDDPAGSTGKELSRTPAPAGTRTTRGDRTLTSSWDHDQRQWAPVRSTWDNKVPVRDIVLSQSTVPTAAAASYIPWEIGSYREIAWLPTSPALKALVAADGVVTFDHNINA